MQTIDFETRDNYILNVTVMDRGFPPLYDSTLVTIYVEDVNDNRPSFNATSYSAVILEADYRVSPMRIATVSLCLMTCRAKFIHEIVLYMIYCECTIVHAQ